MVPTNPQAEMLLGLLFKDIGENYIELMALDRHNLTDKGRPTPYKAWVKTIAEAVKFTNLHNSLRRDVYFGVAPRKAAGGNKEDVADCWFLWADFDTNSLLWQAIPPTAVVYSGSGSATTPNTHCYWQLDRPYPPAEIEEATKSLRALGADVATGKIKADSSYEYSHRLRVPGTKNYKTSPIGRLVSLDYTDPSKVYNLEDIQAFASLKGKKKDVWKYCQTGSYAGFPGESERDFWVACTLYEAGCSDVFIVGIIENTHLFDRPAGEEKHERYATLTVDSAIRKVDSQLQAAISVDLSDDGGVGEKPKKSSKAEKTPKTEKIQVSTASLEDWHEEADGTWYKDNRVSNFVYDATKLVHIDGVSEDYFIGELRAEGQVWQDVTFPRHAFNDVASMVKHLTHAATQWYVNRPELVRLYLTYVYTKLRTKGVPMVEGKLAQGRYGDTWIVEGQTATPEGLIDSTNARMIFINHGSEYPKVAYSTEDASAVIKEVGRFLPFLHRPDIIWPMIGWYWATFHKPQLEIKNFRFPILNIHGQRGSGKTELVEKVFLPLMGHTHPSAYLLSNITPDAIRQLMASSTSIPFAFQEYRSDAVKHKGLLMSLARSSYDNGVDLKGKPGRQIDRTELTAPFSVDGEDPFEDDGGLTQRLLSLMPSADDISGGVLGLVAPSRAYTCFQEITRLPLHSVAGSILLHALNTPLPIERAQRLFNMAFTVDMPDRVRKNLAVTLAGIMSYCDYALKNGISAAFIPEINVDFVTMALSHAFKNVVSLTGDSVMMCDIFIQDVWNYLMMLPSGTIAENQIIRAHMLRGGEIHIHYKTAYQWWLSRRLLLRQGYMDEASLKQQILSRVVKPIGTMTSQYVLSYGNQSGPAGKGSFQGFATNYELLQKAGLDVIAPPAFLRVEV